jgi:hypothetical protein
LLVIHAVRYRRDVPFRWVWIPTAFIVVNIVIATVFLRWHYGIDLVAGTLLTSTAYFVGTRTWRIEGARGTGDDRQEVWESIAWSRLDGPAIGLLAAIVVFQLGVIGAAAAAASP